MLALPTGWSLVIGQAQVAVTLLLALGNPWAVALAANLKVFPVAASRSGGSAGATGARSRWFGGWVAALVAVQLVLEPPDTLAYPSLQSGSARSASVGNLSPYAISPVLWARDGRRRRRRVRGSAPTPLGLGRRRSRCRSSPRRGCSLYQLSTLVAAIREPDGR